MTTDEEKIRRLEMQLDRERRERKRAEELLQAKSLEILDSSRSINNMTERLRLAFWFDHEVVWEYLVCEDAFYLFSSVDDKLASISATGNLEDALNAYHKDDQALVKSEWLRLINNKQVDAFEFDARRYSPEHNGFRWMSVRGRKVLDEKDGSLKKVVGLFRDIHEKYLKNTSLKTISNAFLNTRHPGFIVDFALPHVEVTDSFYEKTDIDKASCSVDYLLNLLPLELIQQQQASGERFFNFTLNTQDNRRINCKFALAELKQEKYNDEYYRYAVGFFRVI